MKQNAKYVFSVWQGRLLVAPLVFFLLAGSLEPSLAQQTVGAIAGTVLDASGGVVQDAEVKARNVGTNLGVTVHSKSNGSYSIPNLPVGTYELSFTKSGFETETHTQVLVTSDRTTTIDGALKVGSVSTTVEVTAVALMNQTDATNGYVVDQVTIQDTPLGTGSFTQLAILTPGVHADFLGGSGSNAGLGNQAIFANGNRDTSNSFSLNGTSTNNLFNGSSTSSIGENRFVLNTGENFGVGGAIQTNSVYGAIGQALPTPPTDAIQEIAVNAAMFDATQGNTSGAHISVVTKSGTNQIHGSAWEQWQSSDMNAAPFFYNASSAITTKVPFLNRNQFGATLGGPIEKDKVFYFLSYQGVRVSDAMDATKGAEVPLGLTNDRTAGGISTAIYNSYGTTLSPTAINSAALDILQAKLPNGQYLIPTPQITTQAVAGVVGYDAIVQGPHALSSVDQGIANLDYQVNDKDRLSGKYYYQTDPTSNPFGYDTSILGFPQTLSAGSQVFTLSNNIILSPTITWEEHAGFTRMRAYSATGSEFNPENYGMSLLGSTYFPLLEISSLFPNAAGSLYMGPSPSFANAGMFQNQWEYESSVDMVKGRHTIVVGGQFDSAQLNIINNNTKSDFLSFSSFTNFAKGKVHFGDSFAGAASRYYRSDTAGIYVNDNFKVRSNLTLTGGLRWDYDGPLSEKYGKLTDFNPALYAYDAATDTITNDGLEFAKNNPTAGSTGPNNSLMNANQWGFAPRIGIAWSPFSKVTVRAGYGIYFDRGEFFSYLSPPAGGGFSGPFGVTMQQPFVSVTAASTATGGLNAPFGTASSPPPPPAGTASAFLAYLPNLSQTGSGSFPSSNHFGPLEFGGYDINNKLPYTQNWTLDLQYQLSNNWLFEIAYVGNHGTHEILPVPFNQPGIATPQNPINGQTSSYGGTSPGSACNDGTLDNQPLCPPPYYAGNAEVRVPYIGYDMNSVLYQAEGISNYHALQVQAHKRLSSGLQFTASYTYSHALDEQSGLGLFVTGNNALVPKTDYASADFDQTHVFLINYSYTIPTLVKDHKALGYAVNGWTIGGQTVAQSGQPYSVYDYSGSVGSLYYGTYDDIGNPIVPITGGIKTKQAELQGTLGVNPATPVLNAADFAPQFVQPGQYGVPPCDASGCDVYESVFGTTGRNTFRGPFQSRFDVSLAKAFPAIKDRFRFRFEADAFNIFNHPDFDTPNNDVEFFPYFEGPPQVPPFGNLGQIQHTLGSSRFLQLSLHLLF